MSPLPWWNIQWTRTILQPSCTSDISLVVNHAVSNGFPAQEGLEDADHDIVRVDTGVLDDGLSQEEDSSGIFEAVGGMEE